MRGGRKDNSGIRIWFNECFTSRRSGGKRMLITRLGTPLSTPILSNSAYNHCNDSAELVERACKRARVL
jgi:hypothetical protein